MFCFFLFISIIFSHPQGTTFHIDTSDPEDYNQTFRIETLVDFYGATSSAEASQYILLGLLAWRDEINKAGGLCLGEGECDEKLEISLVMYQPVSSTLNSDGFLEVISNFCKDILGRDTSKLPDAILTPGGTRESNFVLNLIHQSTFQIPVFTIMSSPQNSATPNSISLIPSYNVYSESFVNILTNRYHLVSCIVVGTGSETSTTYEQAKHLATIIHNRNINILGKRCSKTVTLAGGKECYRDADCPSDQLCLVPRISSTLQNVLDTSLYIYDWVTKLKSYNSDGFILVGDSATFLLFLDSMKIAEWSPKFAGVPRFTSITENSKYHLFPTYWHVGIIFHPLLELGVSGQYMGTTKEWYNLVNTTYLQKYLTPATHPFGNLVMDDGIDNVAVGSAIGITIERGIRTGVYQSTDKRDHYQSFLNVMNALGTCKNSKKACSLDADCTNNETCIPWNTFFGDILIHKQTRTNYKRTSPVGQYIPDANSSYHLSIVYPSDVSYCNINTVCSENDFDKCSCKSVYPAEWEWSLFQANDVIKASSGIGIMHIFLIILTFIATILLMILICLKKTSRFIHRDSGNIYLIFITSLICLSISMTFLFDERTTFKCIGFLAFDIVSSILAFISFFAFSFMLIKNSKNESVHFSLLWRNIVSVLILVTAVVVLWILAEPPSSVTTKYRSINHIQQYSYCELSDFTVSFYITEYIAIFISLLLEVKIYTVEKTKESFLLQFQLFCVCVRSLTYSIILLGFNVEHGVLIDNLLFSLNYCYFVIICLPIIIVMFTSTKRSSKIANDTQIINQKELDKFATSLLDHIYSVHFDMFLREYNLNHYTDFFEYVNKFKQTSDPSGASELSKKIYHDYIITESAHKISIRDTTVEEIKKAIDSGITTPDIFNTAQLDGLQYLQTHSYIDQFKKSKYIPMIVQANKLLKYFQTLSQAVLHGVVESMKKSVEENETNKFEIHPGSTPAGPVSKTGVTSHSQTGKQSCINPNTVQSPILNPCPTPNLNPAQQSVQGNTSIIQSSIGSTHQQLNPPSVLQHNSSDV